MKEIFLYTLLLLSSIANAQVGFGTNNPDPSAAVDITDSARGILIPRMNMAHRSAITNSAVGLMVYQTDSTKGFWYYDGIKWKNINALPNDGGKHRIVLSDTVNNIEAQNQIQSEFGPNTQEITIQSCSNLTSIDLSMFVNLTNISIAYNPVLNSVNLGNLRTCTGCISISYCPLLTDFNVSSLEKIVGNIGCNALEIYNAGLTAINFPNLKFVLSGITLYNDAALTSIYFPKVLQVHYFSIFSNPVLLTVSCPLLQKIGGFYFESNATLTTISFPSLTEFYSQYNYAHILDCNNLSSYSMGNLTVFNSLDFEVQGGKLSSSNINTLLHIFAAISPSLRNNKIKMWAMSPPAPPTGQGIIDKATLIANGNIVLTDN